MEQRKAEVLIVGEGAASLFLAGLFHKYNVSFHLVDASRGPVSRPHLITLDPRTLNIFAAYGLTKTCQAGGELSEGDLEKILIDWLAVGGRGVDWSVEIKGLRVSDQGVEVTFADGKAWYNWVVGSETAPFLLPHRSSSRVFTFREGLEMGIHDVVNLAWKLALTAQGHAAKELLASYALEQKSTHYRASPIVRECPGKGWGFKRWAFQKGPKAGDLAPDASFALYPSQKIQRLYEVFPFNKHLVLFFALSGWELSEEGKEELLHIRERIHNQLLPYFRLALVIKNIKHRLLPAWDDAVYFDEDGSFHQAYRATGPALYIIRPDRYIGFRSWGFAYFEFKRFISSVLEL